MSINISSINIIGAEAYKKKCSYEERWSLSESEKQASEISKAVQKDVMNIRLVQGEFVRIENDEKFWFGDNLGRIAEGLSKGGIQLQKDEYKNSGDYEKRRIWENIPTEQAQGWKTTSIAYVHIKSPSKQLLEQANNNQQKILYDAGTIYPGQYVGLTPNLKVVVGEELNAVVQFIQNENNKEIHTL